MGQAKRRDGKPPRGDGYKENQWTRFYVKYFKRANPGRGKFFRDGPKLRIPKKR